jgi:hypothetical protein
MTNLEFLAITSFQIIFLIKFFAVFLSLYYEWMSCIIPNNILDINLIQVFNSYIKVSNNKLLSLIIFWILTYFRFFILILQMNSIFFLQKKLIILKYRSKSFGILLTCYKIHAKVFTFFLKKKNALIFFKDFWLYARKKRVFFCIFSYF